MQELVRKNTYKLSLTPGKGTNIGKWDNDR